MQVSLVSSALPLPADELNQNVLATETPSQAPAAPSPKQQQRVDRDGDSDSRQAGEAQAAEHAEDAAAPAAAAQNVAQYGEQAGSLMPHQVQTGSNGPTTVGDNGFASLYPWYVDQINRKMGSTWNQYEVDPRTPKGARVYLIFTIHRDGSVSDMQLDRSSGSPTLDTSCERGVQRVDTFGNLPPLIIKAR